MTSHAEEIEDEQISRIEKGKGRDCHGGIETVICTSPSIVCLGQKLIAEMIGTYFIIFSGCAVVVVNVLYGGIVTFPGICVTWGLIVMVMIYSTGHISGAHFNPAVTVTFAIFRRFPWYQVPLYIGAQLTGSILASLTLKLMFKVTPEAYFGTTPHDSSGQALVAEIIISFLLMFVISGVATDSRATGELAGIAVGMTIILNVFVAGPISGASMNPTRSLGPAIVMGVYKGIWVYIVGPFIGILAGGFVYNFMRFTDKPLRELTRSASFLRTVSPNNSASNSKS
ncbi:putative aquaporin NIP4-2 [Cardamine amara subsp. amara]|uniref:Aquaporin NIP4-2 n=1 Tax=Cardamine amara subsp. amara TaxID=228776 RepID=A0ABD1AJP1_CARAN